jgi:hypothetical protein
MRHLPDLSPEQVLDLPQWVSKAVSISLDDVAWVGGEAWLPDERGPSTRYGALFDASYVQREVKAAETSS